MAPAECPPGTRAGFRVLLNTHNRAGKRGTRSLSRKGERAYKYASGSIAVISFRLRGAADEG